MDAIRTRLYAAYVNGRTQALAPETIAGLKRRGPYLKRLIRTYFPLEKDAAILDLGCGHGALVHFSREMGYLNTRGVDGSLEQVTASRRLGIHGIEQADLLDTLRTQRSGSLDLVIAFDVLEHFHREELLPFVDQVLRVLKPNGRWLIHVPNGESPFCGAVRYGDFTHEIAFTRISLDQLLRSSGFGYVRCAEDTPVVHGFASAVRWLLWTAIRSLLRIYVAAETGDASRDAIFTRNLLAVTGRASSDR